MEEYNDYEDEEEQLVDDDAFDIDNSEDDNYLEDDEFMSFEDTTDDDIYEQLSRRKSPYAKRFHPANSFTDNIIAKESGGDYRAFNPNGGGEGAVGKYQFRWTQHKDKIRKFAGANISKEEFMNNPQLQDDFYNNEWIPKYLDKDVKQLKKLNSGLNNEQLYSLVHFRGLPKAKAYLQGNLSDKPESYNSSISNYIGMQKGGIVPIKTNFTGREIPNIELKRPDLPEESKFFNFINNVDYEGIGSTISQGIDLVDNIGNNLAQGISSGINAAEQFTSQQIANQQLRKQMQQLYNDENNYNSNTQRINNNPILT
jgi:hypothetical protein